jgi:hypothetical protein
VTALAVAVIFYIYRGYTHFMSRRRKMLRERVAYMLWAAADQAERNKTQMVH